MRSKKSAIKKCIVRINLLVLLFLCGHSSLAQELLGELKQWHKLTLQFEGPETSEDATVNPFLNYKLSAEFIHTASGESFLVPGYYAADGDAGNTGASGGRVWKVHFTPNRIGEWTYRMEFLSGKWAAIRSSSKLDKEEPIDGLSGAFVISASDKTGRDFRSHGRLRYVGERYLKFEGSGEYFLKSGTDSPENFLAYDQFDGTFHSDGYGDDLIKSWEFHRQDWKAGDPTWKEGKGKEIIGALNYLAEAGLNAVSFLTMNIAGDDKNVFPFIDYKTWDRFDCSKLDQWEVVFSHAESKGIFLHFKTMEAENQGLLDQGGLGVFTRLYYRELIARFGHHLALNWNLCEEAGDWVQSPETFPLDVQDRLRLARYVADTDPYDHHLVIHNGAWFTGIYGPDSPFTGASLQTSREDFGSVYKQVSRVLRESEESGKVWAVACDEPGDHRYSLVPDDVDPEHKNARINALWGTFMAGGWGTEWYFGYEHPHSDLTCQDYRSRELFWKQAKISLDFFSNNAIPYWEMKSMDELINSGTDFVFAKPGNVYLVYVRGEPAAELDFQDNRGKYSVRWFNPRTGGDLQRGSILQVTGGGEQSLGDPPAEDDKDWVILITRDEQ